MLYVGKNWHLHYIESLLQKHDKSPIIRFNQITVPFFCRSKMFKNQSRLEQMEKTLLFCLGHLSMIKILLLPTLIYTFNVILIKPLRPTSSILQLDKLVLNVLGENKCIRIVRKTLKRKKYERRLTLPYIKAHSKAPKNKIVWVLVHELTQQWNRTAGPQINHLHVET